MMQGQERTPGGAPSPDRAQALAIVRTCRGLAEPFVADLHTRLVAALGTSVKSLEAQALDAPDRIPRELIEELNLIRKDPDRLGDAFRQRFTALFSESLRENGEEYRKDPESGTDGKGLELALVDNAQLEEWLAVDTLVARIHERYAREIGALKERFEYLLPHLRLTKYRLPIGPEKFCHAFHDALEQFGATLAHMHCYGLFETVLMDGIEAFYREANRHLASKGVLPSLVVEERPRAERRRADTGAGARMSAPDESWSTGTVASAAGSAVPGAQGPGYGGDQSAGGPGGGVSGGGHSGGGYSGGGYSGNGQPGGGHPGASQGAAGAGGSDAHASGVPAWMSRAAGAGTIEFRAMPQVLGGGDGEGIAGGVHAVAVAPALIETLSALQRDSADEVRTGELIRGGLRHYVRGRFEGAGGSEEEISRLDDETIEIIGMIFNYILDDPALPDFMKALIARLQIPVLKVSLIDREFFTRRDHPARVLLNELAQAGAAWRDENEAARDRLYRAIEEIVRRVLDEFDADVGLFETLLGELRALVEEETKHLEDARGALLEAARRDADEQRLRKGVLGDLAARMDGKHVPEDISEFLLGAWFEYLTAVTLEEGESSAARSDGLDFVGDLLWSIIPRRTSEDRRKLSAMLPGLLQTLNAGMRRLGRDGNEMEEVIRTLERYHLRTLTVKGTGAGRVPDPSPGGAVDGEGDEIDRMLAELNAGLDEIDGDADLAGLASFDDVIGDSFEGRGTFERMIEEMGLDDVQEDTGPRIEDSYTERARALAVGDWLEIDDGNGGTMRARVAWKGDERSAFSFVNRQYKVVAERPFYVLADELRTGAARVIENQGLFDRAIEGVIAGVMKLAGVTAH